MVGYRENSNKTFLSTIHLNVTRSVDAVISELEREIVEFESQLASESDEGAYQCLQERRQLLGSLLEKEVKGSLLRARFTELKDMDDPHSFLLRPGEEDSGAQDNVLSEAARGREVSSPAELRRVAVSFYSDLYKAEGCDPGEVEQLLQGSPAWTRRRAEDWTSVGIPIAHCGHGAALQREGSRTG